MKDVWLTQCPRLVIHRKDQCEVGKHNERFEI